MHAITLSGAGGPEVMQWTAVDDPVPAPGEVLIEVAASAVNRADVMQRMGFYPPPRGASELLGLECSGTIAAVGAQVTGWQVGDQVCALLAGGGYAEKVVVPVGQLLPVPDGVDLVEAAGLPEVACTVWSNVFMLARLQRGEDFLLHGGTSGIGTFAIQLAKHHGARVLTTAGSDDKCTRARELGADVAINYREADFVEVAGEETGGRGVDVILDLMGASYLPRNVDALATGGRIVVIGLQGGRKGELDLGQLLTKRGAVHATSLRGRPVEEKAAIVAEVREHVWPLVATGAVRVIVDRRVPMAEAAEAHRLMEESGHVGKIILPVAGARA